jgi:hypothetical protein
MIETSGEHTAKLVLTGRWMYDGLIPKTVRLYKLNYDFWFELEEGYHEPGQVPELNGDREQFVVLWQDLPFFQATDFPSNGFMTIEDAKTYAESVVRQIDWSITA